jgi:serine/threonine protein kinase
MTQIKRSRSPWRDVLKPKDRILKTFQSGCSGRSSQIWTMRAGRNRRPDRSFGLRPCPSLGSGRCRGGQSHSDAAISLPGVFAGTPEFASPEQFAGAGVDIRSDLYSPGVTLWEMLTGQAPFRDSSAEAIYHHQRVPLPVEQLTFWHRQSFVAGPFRGSTTRNVDPTPSLLTSSMRPRNRRTRRRVMARPSPTPGSVSRQVEAR